MDDDLDDIIDILNKNTDKPPLPKPKGFISVKEDKTPLPLQIRKYDSNMTATCHSGGDMLLAAGGLGTHLIEEESKEESTTKKNTRRRSAAAVQNSAKKNTDNNGPLEEVPQEEHKIHSTQIDNLL